MPFVRIGWRGLDLSAVLGYAGRSPDGIEPMVCGDRPRSRQAILNQD
jgi:hypothetical protein